MATLTDRSLIEVRRDLHAHAEAGWLEFRTTALVAEALDDLGFELHLGAEAVDTTARLGVPDDDAIASAVRRAREEGAPSAYLDAMDGVTGLVATRTYGDGSGPVVGVRVDIDALERPESGDDDHRPAREGFASRHPGEMHACGHDGHTAIGLGVARALESDGGFSGTLKLFLQPAEEGGRGGKAMSRSGHLDDVDRFLALHLGLGYGTGTVVAGFERPLSNAKLAVRFEGEAAHAGEEPNAGRNAVQALATAVTNLYGIPRHGDGVTRINVGRIEAPNAQNVIAEEASMRVEVRGGSAALRDYMLERAERILTHAAGMHDVGLEAGRFGETTTFVADDAMVAAVADAARGTPGVDSVIERADFGASEDASFLIRRVQEAGGDATYACIGADIPSGHHTARFDFDEAALAIGVEVVTRTIRDLGTD